MPIVVESLRLLAAWRATAPRDQVEAFASGADGYEIPQSLAAVMARAGQAVEFGLEGAYYLTAPRGSYATGVVLVTAVVAVDTVLLAGARCATADGRAYVSTADVLFTAALPTRRVPVRGEYHGAGYDSDGGAEPSQWISGHWTVGGAEVAAPASVVVAGTGLPADAVTGGNFGLLDILARDRGVYAAAGEPEESLRQRAWGRPYAVTPADIARLATLTLWASGPTATPPYQAVALVEPQDVDTAWDDGIAGGDGVAWGDADLAWVARQPWVALFLPLLDSQEAVASWTDEIAWGDGGAGAAWSDDDEVLLGIYASVREAVERARAGGVQAFFFLGAVPTP